VNHPLAVLLSVDFRALVFWWIGTLIVAGVFVFLVGLVLTWFDQATRNDE